MMSRGWTIIVLSWLVSSILNDHENNVSCFVIPADTTRITTSSGCSSSMMHASPQAYYNYNENGNSGVMIIDTDERAERDVSRMESWAEETAGIVKSAAVQLTGIPDSVVSTHMDIFWYATDDLAEQTSLLQVPSMSILSSNRAMMELKSTFTEMEDAENLVVTLNAKTELRQFYLMVSILRELERGVDSPWYHYFNAMPRYFSNAASMTDFCFECLPPLVSKLAREERRKLRALTGAAIKRIPFLTDETKYNKELIRFAYQLVYTRAIENPTTQDIQLIPLVDFFNHNGATPNVYMAYDDDGNCYAQTSRHVAAGEPLTFSYADPTNPSHLFARYGFLDQTSEAVFCKIIPAHVNEALKIIGYAENTMLFYSNGEVSPQVWDYLLYQALSRNNVKNKRMFLTACIENDWNTKQQLHDQFMQQTYSSLLQHIDTTLTLLDTLETKTQNKNIQQHPRIPVILQHNNFVRQTFLRVRNLYFGQQ